MNKFTKIMNSQQMWVALKQLYPFMKPYMKRVILGLALTVPAGALDAVIAAFLKPFMDNAIVSKNPEYFLWYPGLIVAFTIIQGGFNYGSTYLNSWAYNKINNALKLRLFEKLIASDSALYDTYSSGMVVARYSNDVATATGGLISNTRLVMTRFFASIGFLAVLLYNAWQLAIVAVFVLLFIFYPINISRKRIKSIQKLSVELAAKNMNAYNEISVGNKIVQSYTLEGHMLTRFKKLLDDSFNLAMFVTKSAGVLSPITHVLTAIGVALVVGFGGHFIMNGTLTSGNFVAFMVALLMLYNPLKNIGNNFTGLQVALSAMERVFEIIDTTPLIKGSDGTKTLARIEKGIQLRGVHFGYNADIEVLHGINIDVPIGKMVAIVGASGGGKSTVCSLITRLYDVTSGEICVDDVNIKDYKLQTLRENIAVVFQDNFIFDGTIRDNIMMGRLNATDEELATAIESAYLTDFIETLPLGLDTQVGENGQLLSGGQKQRVAIARAFIKNAPIVILDEATSSLDNRAEKVVQTALDELMKNRTVIVVAHRLSTVQNADKIVVINEGVVAEEGRHDELLAKQGAYYALYMGQFQKIGE
ncbi:lipid A export permease/ATP-binding protein MsbA [Deferribacterales bacterium RsTz2092]